MQGLFSQSLMDPELVAKMILQMPREQLPSLASLDHNTLYSARRFLPKEYQNLISPYEHRAFAREATQENPWMAVPVGVSIPAYQVYKALFGARSDPSMKQVIEAYGGIYDGLFSRFPKDNE
jgi:hypothetical protein